MYLNFYHLRKEPFHITPDPSFLYLSPAHKEALGALIYGAEQRKGFISITGEVGTGKTTVIRSYLEGIDKDKTKPIYIFNSNSTFKELLRVILDDLDAEDVATENTYALLHRLQEALIEEFRRDHNVVLIIDEAQNMPVHTLENLRMLSNLETTKDKLIQIVLVGQPELDEKLNLPELRQLKQRIAYRAHIHPLSTKESYDYIQFRLDKVRLQREPLFSPTALRRIVDYAAGSPRLINILCDNCLLAGFGYQAKPVSAKIAREVIRDFEGRRRGSGRWKYAIAALLVLGATSYLLSPPAQALRGRLGLPEPGPQLAGWWSGIAGGEAPRETAQPAPAVLPSATVPEERQEEIRPSPITVPTPPVVKETIQAASTENVPSSAEPAAAPLPATSVTPVPTPVVASPSPVASATDEQPAPAVAAATQAEAPAPAVAMEEGIETIRIATSTMQFSGDLERQPYVVRPVRRRADGTVLHTVQQGEILSQLCMQVYGFSSRFLVQWVQEHNPHIQDANQINPGDRILFPVLGEREAYLRRGGS